MGAALVALLLSGPAWSAQVEGLDFLHHDGQTFLTWTSPPGVGWTYRIYRSTLAIQSALDLPSAVLLGVVTDSSWCDRRLYSLCGTAYGFSIDSLAAPLDSTRGLFVATPEAAGLSYYAVTCQAAGEDQDLTITPWGNSLAIPASETPDAPRPVYQRTIIGPWGEPADVYTLWTSDRGTPLFPVMCNRSGAAFDCSVHHGAAGGGLMFHPHVRGGSFYLADAGSGMPGEWVITMDDFIRAPEVNTFWFGYQEDYNIESVGPHVPPVTGTVEDFTARREIFTLEWARRNFPVDTSKVYVMGNSMGGIAGVFLSMWRPDLIAATMVNVPLFDFSFTSDPNCEFGEGGFQRAACNRLWGKVSSDLRMEDGTRVYDRLNAGAMARQLEARFVPPIIAFSGRKDSLLGWAEKIPFYRAMRESRAGGTFFWDMRTHTNTATAGAWAPVQDYSYVYRFRTNLSFPALSNCSGDGNPGDGTPASGDSIGAINGFVEWEDVIVDSPSAWKVRLRLRNLATLWGPVVSAPESVTVDVTPRRLQRFGVVPGVEYFWRVLRMENGVIVQSGTAQADAWGVLTIPGVKVFHTGSMLFVEPSTVGVGGEPVRYAPAPRIAPLPCPLRGACVFAIEWPGAGEAAVDILDTAGRRVRTLVRGRVEGGRSEIRLDPSGLAGGIYFVRARQGGTAAARRLALIR